MKFRACGIFFCLFLLQTATGIAQVPGLTEKWRVTLGAAVTNGMTICGIGQDGATLIYGDSGGSGNVRTAAWISSTGSNVVYIPFSELIPQGASQICKGFKLEFNPWPQLL